MGEPLVRMTCGHPHRGDELDRDVADRAWRGCTYEVLVGVATDSEIREALATVAAEYRTARSRHAPMHSGHEGWAVIREELDELWEHVRSDTADGKDARHEARQVAAMALAYMLEVARDA